MTSVLVRRGDFGHRQAQREDSMKTRSGAAIDKPREGSGRAASLMAPRGSSPADTWVEDFPMW